MLHYIDCMEPSKKKNASKEHGNGLAHTPVKEAIKAAPYNRECKGAYVPQLYPKGTFNIVKKPPSGQNKGLTQGNCLQVQGHTMRHLFGVTKLELSTQPLTTSHFIESGGSSQVTDKDFSTTDILGDEENTRGTSSLSSFTASMQPETDRSCRNRSKESPSPNIILPANCCSIKVEAHKVEPVQHPATAKTKNNSNDRGRRSLLNQCLNANSFAEDLRCDGDFLLLKQVIPVKRENRKVDISSYKSSCRPEKTCLKFTPRENDDVLKHRPLIQWKTTQLCKKCAARDQISDPRFSEHERMPLRPRSHCQCCYGSFFPSTSCNVHGVQLVSRSQQCPLPLLDWSPADVIQRAVDDALKSRKLVPSLQAWSREIDNCAKASTDGEVQDAKYLERERQKKRKEIRAFVDFAAR